MNTTRSWIRKAALAAAVACTPAALGQTVLFDRPMTPGGGTLRNSQLWVDPSGHDDLDSDAIAWANFTLTQAGTVSRLEWIGQALPPLGFEIAFFNQDPNTVASQPDIFRVGGGPISEEVHPAPAVAWAGAGLYRFTVDLDTPLPFEANTRYFVSVIGLTPVPFATWGWAQAEGPGSTFYWSRGAHMYFNIAGGRAFTLSGTPEPTCPADLSGSSDPNDAAYGVPDGVADSSDFFYYLDQFAAGDLGVADLSGSTDPNDPAYGVPDGLIDASDFFYYLDLFVAGCP